VEWIVTTGRSIEEAKEKALDQLGVAEDDAEFEVEEEAKPGLFGRLRREARVRARVRPVQPRPKVERRRKDGRRRGGQDKAKTPAGTPDGGSAAGADAPAADSAPEHARGDGGSAATDEVSADDAVPGEGSSPSGGRARRRRGGSTRGGGSSRAAEATTEDSSAADTRSESRFDKPAKDSDALKGAPMSDVTIPLPEHAERVKTFVAGLVDSFDLEAEIAIVETGEDTAEVQLEGENLGILIGRGGATLQAVQTLARSAIQRHNDGDYEGRVFVEVSGYRQRRKEALAAFTLEVIEQVTSSGNEVELEPMGSADRKVVHDTANEAGGVRTSSVGEEPRRRVVISPAD